MYLEWRRSWNSCRWPERVIITTNGVSDHLEATNYFIGYIVDHFDASTMISLGATKNMARYREAAGSTFINQKLASDGYIFSTNFIPVNTTLIFSFCSKIFFNLTWNEAQASGVIPQVIEE